jgi:hypothetical protein
MSTAPFLDADDVDLVGRLPTTFFPEVFLLRGPPALFDAGRPGAEAMVSPHPRIDQKPMTTVRTVTIRFFCSSV